MGVEPASDALPTRAIWVAEQIEKAVLRGELAPGERLIERTIAEQLRVSKTPVREALRTLARKGVVETNPYRGTVVRTISATEATHIYEVRLLLEPDAVVSALRNHDATSLEMCEEVLQAASTAGSGGGDLADLSILNRRFHRLLYARCGNDLLRRILDDVQDQVAMITVATWRRRTSWTAEASEHTAILEAVRSGDPQQVRQLMRDHISTFLSRVTANT